jgi:hypothetical protein
MLACQALSSSSVAHVVRVLALFKESGLAKRIRTDNGVPFVDLWGIDQTLSPSLDLISLPKRFPPSSEGFLFDFRGSLRQIRVLGRYDGSVCR